MTAMTAWVGMVMFTRPRMRRAAYMLIVVGMVGCGEANDGLMLPSRPATITLSWTAKTLTFIGQTSSIRAIVRDASGRILDRPVAWASSDPAIFGVVGDGVVTALANGSGELRASVEGLTAQASVIVDQRPAVVAVLSGDGQEAVVGSTLRDSILVQVTDAGGTGVRGVVISFTPGAGAGSTSPENAVSAAGGLASTAWTLGGDKVGDQTLTVFIEQGIEAVALARANPILLLPDLAIDGTIVLSPEAPTNLETFDVGIRVANIGDAVSSSMVPVTILVDGELAETDTIGTLAVDERVNLIYTVGPLDHGSREIAVVLDAAESIEEHREDNNRSSTRIDVVHQHVIRVDGKGVAWSGQLSGDSAAVILFRLDVSETLNETLTVHLSGGLGDVDIFLDYGERPVDSFGYRCYSVGFTTSELCQEHPTRGGTYHLTAYAYSDFGPTDMTITVGGVSPYDSYDIELVFLGQGSNSQKNLLRAVAELWEMAIKLGEPDIDFARYPRLPGSCGAGSPEVNDVVDDIRIFVTFDSIDGAGGALGQATPCSIRYRSDSGRYSTPITGRMLLDEADAKRMEAVGTLGTVMLHELAHVLGFGTVWREHGLLVNPSVGGATPNADTHYAGPLAIAAFDDAGGNAYADAKVPVQSGGEAGVSDGHWRDVVFGPELMTSFLPADGGVLLSAITIESLADLGYSVDTGYSDSYRLPGLTSLAYDDWSMDAIIDFGDDIVREPIKLVDITRDLKEKFRWQR